MNEKNVQVEKIQKTSKVVLAMTNVVKVIMIVAAIICFVSGIGLSAINICMGNEALRSSEVMMQLDQKMLAKLPENENSLLIMGIYIITLGFVMIGIMILYSLIGKVFKALSESYSPFVPQIIKELKVAFVLIALLSFGAGIGIGIIVSLALWCVFQIFEYGCELQKQSDETL